MIVVFLGPPGSGKGTQAQVLREHYGFTHFDTGSQLRAEIATGSALGKRIASYTDAGQLVPIPIIKELILKFLRSTAAERILFDGFPRNMEQARVLDEGLAELGDDLDHVVYLDAPQDALLTRIVYRRYCPACGEIFNLVTEPPKADGVCDTCGTALVQRKDDSADVFGARLQVYLQETAPLLELYSERGLLRSVPALQTIDAVTAGVVSALGVESGAEA